MSRKTFRKQITTDEYIDKINEGNKSLQERFLKEKKSRSSALTIKSYKSDLDIFFVWNLLYNKNKHFTEIRKLELSDFFIFATEDLQWSSARFSRMKSVLSSFSNFIEKYYDEDFPTFRNIVLKSVEAMPKHAVREKTILSEEQVNGLFEYLDSTEEYQISCWLALAIGSGSRFSELLRFEITNIDFNNVAFDGIFIETLKPIKTKGRGVAGKMLYKYIIKDIFCQRYEKWMEVRNKIMFDNGKIHDFIFIKPDGSPATEGTARTWVTKIEDYLKVPFYPHALRHYATTYLAYKKIPHELIRELWGWESTDMVKVYNDMTAKDQAWPELGNLKIT
jgi:integrase